MNGETSEIAGWRVERYGTLDSTMRVAAMRPPRTAVVAAEQTAGIGRHGHSWHSEKDTGLYVSLMLGEAAGARTPDMPVVTLALGLAVVEAIQQATGILCDLRWPNDVILGGRKTAGILVQLTDGAAIAGIGINVNHTAFPPEIAADATSLRLFSGRAFACADLLPYLLRAVDTFIALLRETGKEAVLDLFARASSYVSGRRVVVDERIEGVTAGLDASGFLRLRKDDGEVVTIFAGGVRATGA